MNESAYREALRRHSIAYEEELARLKTQRLTVVEYEAKREAAYQAWNVARRELSLRRAIGEPHESA